MDQKTQELMFSSINPCYETPDDLFFYYRDKYNIVLDVCATDETAKCAYYMTPEDDCLSCSWEEAEYLGFAPGAAWMNPPYNKPMQPCDKKKECSKTSCEKRGFCLDHYVPGQIDFVRKASEEAQKGHRTTVCLLPVRTDTKVFHKYIYNKKTRNYRDNVEVEYLEGRIKFKGAKAGAPFPSMIVIFHKAE